MSHLGDLVPAASGPEQHGVTRADSPPGHLRLLSYNIQAGISMSRFRHYLIHSWKHVLPHAERLENLDAIARVLSAFDVVALQEVDAGSLRTAFVNQSEYLAEKAGFPYWYDQTVRRIGRLTQHALGVLTRYKPDEITEHKLPGMIPGRGVLCVRFGQGPEALNLLIVHLALGRRTRLRQMDYISELLADKRNIILMGDLNCHSRSPEMDQLLAATKLREPAHDLHTFPSWRPRRNIDHILISESLRVERADVLDYPLSDHLPIAMDVVLPDGLVLEG